MNRTFLIVTIVLLGLSVVALAGTRPPPQPAPIFASPAATPVADSSLGSFLPVLHDASEQADLLVTLGKNRERNLLRLRAEQGAMLSTLTAADAWLAAHAPVQDDPTIAAYRAGAGDIRAAMNEAQAGLLRLDFERVARANDTLQEGARSLHEAIDILAQS